MPTQNVHPTMFLVEEKYIDHAAVSVHMSKEHAYDFERCESPSIDLSDCHVTVNGTEYDYVLNCTNNQFVPFSLPFKPTYETVCSLLYKIDFAETTALTVMDGPFFSIYPYDIDNNLYTITHVTHSVIYRGPTVSDIACPIDDVRAKIETDVFSTFPTLRDMSTYLGFFTSNKTKYDFEKDDRSLRWFSNGRYASFSGGKITGIFEMESILNSYIQ
jgi:hypothetical protein